MSGDIKNRLYGWLKSAGSEVPWDLLQDVNKAKNHIEELEVRLKKAIEIIDDYAYDAGKWIDPDIDYEEFYSWREDLS